MKSFFRGEIVFHTPTCKVGTVSTDPLGGLPRATLLVVVNVEGGTRCWQRQVTRWNAADCLSLGYEWGAAWTKLRQMRDEDGWPLVDARLGAGCCVTVNRSSRGDTEARPTFARTESGERT